MFPTNLPLAIYYQGLDIIISSFIIIILSTKLTVSQQQLGRRTIHSLSFAILTASHSWCMTKSRIAHPFPSDVPYTKSAPTRVRMIAKESSLTRFPPSFAYSLWGCEIPRAGLQLVSSSSAEGTHRPRVIIQLLARSNGFGCQLWKVLEHSAYKLDFAVESLCCFPEKNFHNPTLPYRVQLVLATDVRVSFSLYPP